MQIRPRDRSAIIDSLRAGVVPKTGLQHIQVGRSQEIESLTRDLEKVADGGAAFRLIIGEYGAGKTFFLYLVRAIAIEKKFVVASADLSPERRIQATSGQGRALYAELMRNLSTRGRPDGSALEGILDSFISTAKSEAEQSETSVPSVIKSRLKHLEEMVGGYDFATVIEKYWEGFEASDDELTSSAVRWLRAEFTTKTDARKALGVRTIIDDNNFYDSLKILARFVRASGYTGLIVNLDELVNLFKLGSSQARASNYEQILRMLNDSLQGSAEGIGFLLGGTPEFLLDPRRGLFSYQALATRLGGNTFARDGLVDFNSPVINLPNLSSEDLYILFQKIRSVYWADTEKDAQVPDEAIIAYMAYCQTQIGERYFRTPRNSIRGFIDLLSVLDQNPGTTWNQLVDDSKIAPDFGDDSEAVEEDDDGLTTLRL